MRSMIILKMIEFTWITKSNYLRMMKLFNGNFIVICKEMIEHMVIQQNKATKE